MTRTALIAGATGLVGGHCLRLLLDEPAYTRVIALGRRAPHRPHPKLEQRVVDFARLSALADPPPADDAFCCLGTTLRRAGSREAFRRVDLTYVREFTRFAVERGAQRVLLVSALGADPGARNFYSRVKGEAEIAVREVAGAGAHLFRPSLLVGQRAEVRLGERAGIALSRALRFLFVGPLRRYVPIAAESVARAMVRVALDGRSGPRAYRSDEIATLGAVVDDDTGRGVRNPP
jgi:uncharacterized protein YbjT (DUF2867 family)